MSVLIIDADSHITEPPDVWTSRVAAKDVERVPHVVRNDDGRDIWVLNDAQIDTVGVTAPAGWDDFPATYPPRYEDLLPGSYRGADRIKYMDQAGIWAQVLYPNVAGFGAQRFLNMNDSRLQLECVRAYNDFQHEWVSVAPHRLIPNISLPFWDVQASVAEIERCADLDFRSILFTGEPQRFGLPVLGDRHWDPLYDVAQQAGMPMHFHIGGGEDNSSDRARIAASRRQAHGTARSIVYGACDLFLKNGIQCADLISSGVLERFPRLNFVSVESGIGWVPFMLEAADYSYLGAIRAGRKRMADDLLPSDLFRRQVYVTYWFEQIAPKRLLADLPIDNVLFETDFPHTACLYGNILETIDGGLADVPADVREKFLWRNSARLYSIEVPESQARRA